MKRKFDSISNNKDYQPQQKRRRICDKKDMINFFLQQLEKQEKKLNSILERVNSIDNRLKNVENFIEENTQPKLPPINNYSYFY